MKLLGSTTSPYVRRTRLLLADRPYDFVNLAIYAEDRDELRRQNPALRIPVLQDGDLTLFDSRVIARYLSQKFELPALTWAEENLLTVIDAANDAYVVLFQAKRSGLDIEQDSMLFNLQRERVEKTLGELADQVSAGAFGTWNYPAICLYCLVDWVAFRELHDFAGLQVLVDFRDRNRQQPAVAETDPRLA